MARPSARPVEARALELLDRAMEKPEAEREAFIRASRGASVVKDRALALLGLHADASLMLPTGGAPAQAGAAPMPERIGAYRITGLIGQGGMGAVYRGERAGDFDHTVAIKVIRPGALSSALIERFRRERQTLARLAHPNIARLFDGGETEAGDPFIVMEFVDGRRLDVWLDDEHPGLAARLDLFLAVAAAVAFAHQNLVVHGDVTPSNVLVDADGRPKLIDFGIARPAGEALAATPSRPRSAARSLTPGFAAPERLAGQPATTLSDIYSLGRVLGRLLEGQPADAELAAVVARATVDDPGQRYSTVEELRRDVTAHLRGFPVAAVGSGRGYVFRKFVARHRLAVGGAVSAASLIVVSLGLALAANARAEAARGEAEARFEDVRSLAKVMMFDVYDEVSKVPDSQKARLLLARSAQTYLDSLAADSRAPVDVKLEAGEGYFRLGRVIGFTGGGSLGRREEGKVLLAKSHRILEALYAEHPERADVRLALGHQLSTLAGESLYSDGDAKTARQRAIRARELLTALPEQTERSAGALAGAYLYEGDSYGWDNDIPGAGRVYEQGLAYVRALPPSLRDSAAVRVPLATLLRQAGEVYRYTDRPVLAVERMQQAVALNRDLVAASNGSPATLRKLITSLWSLADMQRIAGQIDAAFATAREGHTLALKAVAENPDDADALEIQALIGVTYARVLSERGAAPEASVMAQESLRLRRALVARSGRNKGQQMSLANSLKELAEVYWRSGDAGQACGLLVEARDILVGYKDISEFDRQNNLKPIQRDLGRCRA